MCLLLEWLWPKWWPVVVELEQMRTQQPTAVVAAVNAAEPAAAVAVAAVAGRSKKRFDDLFVPAQVSGA